MTKMLHTVARAELLPHNVIILPSFSENARDE
jgi:hypothetical protein